MLPTAMRPFLAALLGPILVWAIAKFTQFTGIQYAPETVEVINNGVILLIAVGITKVFVNKKVNPANAASSGLAQEGKMEERVIKAADKQESES